MRAESQTAHSYLLVDKLVLAVERYLAFSTPPACGYSKEVLWKRLAQAIVMHLTDPFLKMQLENRNSNHTEVPVESAVEVMCAGLRIDTRTGEVKPSAKLLFLSAGKFLVLWLYVLPVFVRALFGRKAAFGKAALVYGVPDADLRADGSALRFEEFCQQGNLEVLRKASRYVVQATKPVVTNNEDKFIYARFPLLTLFERNKLGFVDGVLFFANHLLCLFFYIWLIVRTPISCLLWRDYAENSVALALNRRHLIQANIITNSNWLQQIVWMTNLPARNFLTLMALYSLNSSRLVFKNEPGDVAEHPGLRHLNVDCVLIWNKFYEKELRRLGISCATQTVGPVLWYLPEKISSRYRCNAIRRICVFDVPPKMSAVLDNLGLSGSYYNAEVMMCFLDDLLFVASEASCKYGVQVEVILKQKRARHAWYDAQYYQFVDQLLINHPNLSIVSESSNLYSLISNCDVVIAIPYSSPAHVASYLRVPSIFYDPTEELKPVFFDNTIQFSSGRGALNVDVMKALRGNE